MPEPDNRRTVSWWVALLCWLSFAAVPYWWLTTGFSAEVVFAAVFWFAVGTVASVNTFNVRRKPNDARRSG